MSISRRSALKQFLLITGGVMLVPACMQQDNKTSIALTNLKIDGRAEKMLAELAETILPATSTPGAKDLYLHQFILKMTDDCSTPEDIKAFEQGLKAFMEFTEKKEGAPFVRLSAAQRTSLLQGIEAKKDVPEAVVNFYNRVKGLSIQGYLTTKHYLTQVQVYELVPGRYRGCVPKSEIEKPSIRPA